MVVIQHVELTCTDMKGTNDDRPVNTLNVFSLGLKDGYVYRSSIQQTSNRHLKEYSTEISGRSLLVFTFKGTFSP